MSLPNCDCGACCEQCGHKSNCIRNERNESEDDMTEEEARLKSGLLTVKEVAEELRIGRAGVYRLIHSGEIGAIRVGGVFRVSEAEVLAYKKRQSTPTTHDDEEQSA